MGLRKLGKLGKRLMGGSVVAGLADAAAIVHEKSTIENLSNALQISNEILEKTMQKLSEIKHVTVIEYQIPPIVSKPSPVKFAFDYLTRSGECRDAFSPMLQSWVEFYDGHSIGTTNSSFLPNGLKDVIKEIGGYGERNTAEYLKNSIQSHQNYLLAAESVLVPLTIIGALGTYYYLRAGGGAKIKKALGSFYDNHIRNPLAMRKMDDYLEKS